jgi:ABC-type phosphate transport system substrate-binding protein
MKSLIVSVYSATLLLLSGSLMAYADDVVVITNPGVTISSEDIKDIYIGEKQFAGSTKLIVVDNASAQGSFLSKFLQIDTAKYNNIWTKKSFRDGLTPPAVKSGDAEVTEFVKRTPGAVGYVSTAPAGVNIVH